MQAVRLDDMTVQMLEEHVANLKRARDETRPDDAPRAGLDRAIAAAEQEIGRRPPAPPTGLETLTAAQLLDRFIVLAKSEDDVDDNVDYSEAIDALYWKLDDVRREFERRDGNAGALIALYTHPDIRVRSRAAEFTQAFAPALARSRSLAIEDEDWVPPRDLEAPAEVPPKLAGMTAEALIERFLDIALRQGDALDRSEIPRFNRLYGQLDAVELALKERDGDQRLRLLPFLGHASAQVRLRAACAVRDLAPSEAIRALQALSDRDEYPQAADARGKLTKLGIKWHKE